MEPIRFQEAGRFSGNKLEKGGKNMRLAGIITEYDPFHTGHAWQLRRARELVAQVIAVCMSEDLTQRGSAALLPPAVRL